MKYHALNTMYSKYDVAPEDLLAIFRGPPHQQKYKVQAVIYPD